MSTSPVPLCLFLALNKLNKLSSLHWFLALNKLNKHKRTFNIAFIKSCPLASNHAIKKVDLSFAGFRCPDVVKLN